MKYKYLQILNNEEFEIETNYTFKEIENMMEELECIKMFLDSKNIVKQDVEGNEYSFVGRIELYKNYELVK